MERACPKVLKGLRVVREEVGCIGAGSNPAVRWIENPGSRVRRLE